jgi:VIT1/CCC1 family predicted Fe2+/Mn2+ transporter
VPFNNRFADVTPFQKNVYFVTLLFATGASVCLIAPTIHHRIEFRRQDKEHIVLVSNRLSIAGLTFLSVAMTGAILLITDVLFGAVMAATATTAVAVVFAVVWYAMPLGRLRRR